VAIGQYPDQDAVGQLITHQSQHQVSIPSRQQDRPITADRSHPSREAELRDLAPFQNPIFDAGFQSDHKMGSGIEQHPEQVERKIAAVEQVCPSGAPDQIGNRFQIVDFP